MSRLLLLATAVLLNVLTASAAAGAERCTNVRGTLVFHQTGPDSFESALSGDLEGTLIGTNFRIVRAGEDGTLHGVVDHEFITAEGTFNTFAEVVLSPIGEGVYRANERNLFLSGGTGACVGVTGSWFSTRLPISASAKGSAGITAGSAPLDSAMRSASQSGAGCLSPALPRFERPALLYHGRLKGLPNQSRWSGGNRELQPARPRDRFYRDAQAEHASHASTCASPGKMPDAA